jgi:N-formylglutamate deformylase
MKDDSMNNEANALYTLHRGTAPVLVSLPHDGTFVPDAIAARMTDSARRVPDTDWHVSRLYAFARDMGASVIVPKHSRYVIDLNRSEDDVSLYPGQNTTGLCPIVKFSGEPVYREGTQPMPDEIRARIETYWRPFHDALRTEIERIRTAHGRVVLWEGHSIRSVVPFLFDGRLPDFNLGTANGASCSPALQGKLMEILDAQSDYSFVANGRFKGGHITRHYGDPANGIDAVQFELAQLNYMDEESFAYDEAKAQSLQVVIRRLLASLL